MTDRVGQQLGNYRLLEFLGKGGFAEVYLGEHIHLKTFAAIKVLRTQLTQQEQQGFLPEARTIAHLEHPNIVRLLEYGVDNETPFLVMSYAPNGTLRQRYPHGTLLPLPQVVSYVKQVASALQYAHDEHIIHRDVKPENMLIGRQNEILLSDFGIAQVAHSEQSLSVQNVSGTPSYMAPEQFVGKSRPASDQYSLGVVLYEWLCGERPFSQGDFGFQHNYVPPPPLYERLPTIPLAVEQVVMQALAKKPDHRFATIQEFALRFETASQAGLSSFSQEQRSRSQVSVPLFFQNQSNRSSSSTVPSPLMQSQANLPLEQSKRLSSATALSPHLQPRTNLPLEQSKRSSSTPMLSPRVQPRAKRRTLFATLFILFFLITAGITLSPLVSGQLLKLPSVGQAVGQKNNFTPTKLAVNSALMPPTQTSCPSDGKARALVTAPLTLGNHAAIIYVDNNSLYLSNHPKSVLRNYDTLTKKTTVILEEDQTILTETQVSSDGQWIFFVAKTNGLSALQVVRVDGQGLQTLYCTKGSIRNMAYSIPSISPNHGWLAFNESDDRLKLLNTFDGTLKSVSTTTLTGQSVMWDLSNKLYVLGDKGIPAGPVENVYVLDPETLSVKTFMSISGFCLNFSILLDASRAFISQCQGTGGAGPGTFQSPSSLSVSDNGSPLQSIFSSSTFVIRWMIAISGDTLLFDVDYSGSQSGIWKIKTDGTDLVQLAPSPKNTYESLPLPYSWSVASHDGAMYAFLSVAEPQGSTSLYFGSLAKPGSITPFATLRDKTGNENLAIVGWTTS